MIKKVFPYVEIAVGSFIGALAVNLFMVPVELPSGGLSGLALILYYLWGLPTGSVYFLMNVPALIFLFRIYGWGGVVRTIWGTVSFSLLLQLTLPLSAYAPTHNVLLASIYAGVLMGLGVGLILRAGGSAGGTSAIGKVVRHYTGIDISRFVFIFDNSILLLSVVAVSVEAVLYGMVATYLVTRMLQTVLEGFTGSRCALIITRAPDDVSDAILADLKRGVTRISAEGGYTHSPRPVLMCVVAQTEVLRLRRLVLGADPDAFLLITDAREVNGHGFTLDSETRKIPFWALRTPE